MHIILNLMYTLIMFDMDGTLLDTFDGLMNSLNDTLAHFGERKLSKEEIKPYIGPRVYDTFRNDFNKNHDESTKMTDWFRDNYISEHLFEAHLYPNVIDSLDNLKSKGFEMVIVTNKRYDYANKLVDYFELRKYFDKVYGTDFENTLSKHNLIIQCLNDYNIKAKSALLIGDTTHDLEAAEKCKVDFVPVSYGFGKWNNRVCIDRLDGWLSII